MVTMIIVGLVTAFLVAPSFLAPLQPDRNWQTVNAADASPGASNSGVINVYIVDNSDAVDYDSTDLSEGHASVYAHFGAGASLDAALSGNVPYDTEFDIVIECQYNYTHAYNTSTPGWDVDYVKGLITCADLSIGADTEMSESTDFISNTGSTSSDTAKINFYMDNGGSGYTMSHGETFNVTSFKMQAYY